MGRVLCVAVLMAALALSGTGAGYADGGHGGAPGDEVSVVSGRAERLMKEAAHAVAAHEKAKAAVGRGERRLGVLEHRRAARQHRLDALRADLGAQARSEYRGGSGLGTVIPLITSSSPQQALDAAVLAGRGDRAAGQLAARTTEARDRVVADRDESARLVKGLRAQAARRSEALGEVEAKLAKAQEELRLAQQRAQALLRVRKGAAKGAATGAPGGVPTSAGGCARGTVGGQRRAGAGQKWVAPVGAAPLSAGFGQGGSHWANRHTGQDFAVGTGTPVGVVEAGTVEFTGCGDGFGNQVIVRHADGYFTQYGHLSVIGVRAGQHLKAGEVLGLSGATGNVSGPHLHFEVRVTPQFGSGIDPLPWLRARGLHV